MNFSAMFTKATQQFKCFDFIYTMRTVPSGLLLTGLLWRRLILDQVTFVMISRRNKIVTFVTFLGLNHLNFFQNGRGVMHIWRRFGGTLNHDDAMGIIGNDIISTGNSTSGSGTSSQIDGNCWFVDSGC